MKPEDIFVTYKRGDEPVTTLLDERSFKHVGQVTYRAIQKTLAILREHTDGRSLGAYIQGEVSFEDLKPEQQSLINETLIDNGQENNAHLLGAVFKDCKGNLKASPEFMLCHPAVGDMLHPQFIKQELPTFKAIVNAVQALPAEDRSTLLLAWEKTPVNPALEKGVERTIKSEFSKHSHTFSALGVSLPMQKMGLVQTLLGKSSLRKQAPQMQSRSASRVSL